MLFKKTAGTFIAKVVTSVINLVIVIVLSRWIGAHGKGEASIVLAGITMLLLFCNIIGGASLVYLVPRYNIFQLAVISNLWSLAVCVVSYFILSMTTLISVQFIAHVCLLALISSFIATNLSILLGREKIARYNLVSFLQSVINLIALVVLIKSFGKANTGSYIVSLYIAMCSCLLLSTIMIFPYLRSTNIISYKKIITELARLGVTNQAGHVVKFISFRMSYFLLSSHVGDAGVGIFSNGTSLVESILLITNSIATVQYSTIANSQDINYSKDLTVRLTRLSILLCLMAMIPLMLLPGPFFVWLFGQEFTGVRSVILLLAPGILCYNVALITGHYFSGTGKYWVNTAGNIAGLIITIILSAVFIASYNITTAAIISTVAYIFTTITILYYFFYESKTSLAQLIPMPTDLKWGWNKLKELAGGF